MSNVENTLPTKPFWESFSGWGAVVTLLLGIATQLGVSGEVVDFLRINWEAAVGAVFTLIGVFQAFATLRRKTRITLS